MHTVRKQILDILKERNQATVADLAIVMEMPAVSVRHHLDILQGDNLIRVERLDRSGGVGRPQQVYALTDDARRLFPNNFAALAGNLVRQIKQVLPPDQVECAFRNMAGELAREFACLPANEPIEERLQRVTEFLNQRGYLAHWQQDGDTQDYLLQKCNCPYSGVAAEHGELCAMDQSLIDQLMGSKCERTHSMAAGASSCTYRISATAQLNPNTHPTLQSTLQSPQRSAIALFA